MDKQSLEIIFVNSNERAVPWEKLARMIAAALFEEKNLHNPGVDNNNIRYTN